MFNEPGYRFQWKDLGDIQEGRPNLGPTTDVLVYRLMQYSLRDVLNREIPIEDVHTIFRNAGELAGSEFCQHTLNTRLNFDQFIADLQAKLKVLNIGILRVEEADLDQMRFVLTVAEDLDCSGLPPSGETICQYDEGFIAGILQTYTGDRFVVKEVDCWASGGRICRFQIQREQAR